MCKMEPEDLNLKFQTALIPENFMDLINYKEARIIETNEKRDNKKYYHKLVYNDSAFITNTDEMIFDL